MSGNLNRVWRVLKAKGWTSPEFLLFDCGAQIGVTATDKDGVRRAKRYHLHVTEELEQAMIEDFNDLEKPASRSA